MSHQRTECPECEVGLATGFAGDDTGCEMTAEAPEEWDRCPFLIAIDLQRHRREEGDFLSVPPMRVDVDRSVFVGGHR